MEDQRQAAVRSAAAGGGLPGDAVPRCSGSSARWPEASVDAGAAPGAGGPEEAAFRTAMAALDATPAFQPARAAAAPTGGSARSLAEPFVLALDEALRRASCASQECLDDLAEAVAGRLANTAQSRYEHPAASMWPAYAKACPSLLARIHLSPSGLATYSLGPPPSAPDAASWELSGESCWKLLPPDGRPTEVVLELCQGLEGSSPPQTEGDSSPGAFHREPPCVLRVDLRECLRISDGDGDSDEEGSEEEEEEDDEAEAGGT